jgi:hypothetical protein
LTRPKFQALIVKHFKECQPSVVVP